MVLFHRTRNGRVAIGTENPETGVMNPPIRFRKPQVAWPSEIPPGIDFKPQFICSLVFAVRIAGVMGSSLSVPAGTEPLIVAKPQVAIAAALLMVSYAVVAAGLARGYFASFVQRRLAIALDVASVIALNIWASSVAVERQLDIGGNDVFWMAAIGSIALWGAVHGRVVVLAMMGGGAALLMAMSYANGFTFAQTNWSFVASRIVFAGIGVTVTACALRISERFEELRRIQGHRSGEQQALGAMHRRALQDLKVIIRLTGEGEPGAASASLRLDEVRRHSVALAEYVRTWPDQHQEPLDIDDAIRGAVAEANHLGSASVEMETLGLPVDVEIPTEVLAAVQEAVGEAVANAVQHATPDATYAYNEGPRVTAVIDQQTLLIDISDSGPGFDADMGDLQTSSVDDGDRELKSTGLGLTRIVDVMESVGGSAVLTTAPGQGATWTLSVDVGAADTDPETPSPGSPRPTNSDGQLAS
jgi:anti-sigma regulatory factor (Ser/Thr protein kinase)